MVAEAWLKALFNCAGDCIVTGVLSLLFPSNAGPVIYGSSLMPDQVVLPASVPVRLAWFLTTVPFGIVDARVISNVMVYCVFDPSVRLLMETVPSPLVPQLAQYVNVAPAGRLSLTCVNEPGTKLPPLSAPRSSVIETLLSCGILKFCI